MKFLKDLQSTLKQLGIKIDPRVWVLLAVLVPLGIGAVLWFRKKKKKPEGAEGEAAVSAAVVPPKPNTRKLRAIWSRFVSALPGIYRRSILRFQPFVVLGGAGSGKSQVIDAYTDWRRQEKQFVGSATDDPNLQIYLGSRALVFELPAPLAMDSSSATRRLLLRLWRPLFRRRRPVVVAVLDLPKLGASAPDTVRNLADTLRGKINLLMEIHRAPVEVRLALTHLDQVEGFAEFASFLAARRLPSVLRPDLSSEQDYALEGALQESFAEFDRLLPLALTTVSAEAYLRVVAFLREMPKQLSSLRSFLPSLTGPDALQRRPLFEGIYLASSEEALPSSSPFHLTLDEKGELPDPRRMHRQLAGAAALLGIGYMAFSYAHERGLWVPSRNAMYAYQANRQPGREPELRAGVTRFRDRSERDALMRVTPSFFSPGEHQLDNELTQAIRDRNLLPGLDRAMSSDWAHRKSLYYLALLYSTRDNALGKLVLSRLDHWADSTGLDPRLISDYIASAETPYEKKPDLSRLPNRLDTSPVNDPQPWILYFLRVQRAVAGGSVTPEQLADLQQQAGQLLAAQSVVERFEETAAVLHDLDDVTGYDFQSAYQPFLKDVHSSEMFGNTLPDVKQALVLIRSAQVAPAAGSPLLLADLCAKLKLILDQKGSKPGEELSMRFGDQSFKLKPTDWEKMVRNSAASEQVRAFVHDNSEAKRSIFFAPGAEKGAMTVMNAGANGGFLFTGKASLPDRFTRAAFDRDVRPVVAQFNDLLGQLALAPEERRLLEDFVYREMVGYAGEYVEAIDHYYNAYGVKAESPEAVRLLIKQMLRPDSPFRSLLQTVAANTQLELDEKNRFFQPVHEALKKYDAIGRVMADKGGGARELDTYQTMLEQLLQALQPEPAAAAAPAPPGKAPDQAAQAATAPVTGLVDLLTPSGKASLRILQGEKDSYWQLVHLWLKNEGIPDELAEPFIAPVDQLYVAGLREIEAAVSEEWNHQILVQLNGLLTSFPFDPSSSTDAKADELTEYFHPVTGKFQDLRHRFLDPISQKVAGGWTWRVGARRMVDVPTGMYEVINRVDRLSVALWDGQGKPQSIKLQIAPVPFTAHQAGKTALTLVYLSSGTNALFNFNQQPSPKTIELDWTHPKRAQIGLELTDTFNGEKTYPSPIVTGESPWSLLHLLALGTRVGNGWGWVFRYGKDNEQVTMVSFTFDQDPWRLFDLHSSALRLGRNMSEP